MKIRADAIAADTMQRWIFWINLPFIGVAFIFVPLFLKLNFKASNFADQLERVDWVGSVLFVGSTTSFLIPITWVRTPATRAAKSC
jgi:hypothetical protein